MTQSDNGNGAVDAKAPEGAHVGFKSLLRGGSRKIYRIDPDDDLVEELRREAVKLAYQAEAAWDAHESALRTMWWERARNKIGCFYPSEPAECVLTFRDGPQDIKAVKVCVDYEGTPQLVYLQRTKSGKWGKTEYQVDTRWAVKALSKKST